MLRGLPLAVVLSIPLWALIIAGAWWVTGAAHRGELPVLSLRGGEPFGGER